MIAVSPDEMRIILGILREHAQGCDVRVFGSRVGEDHKKFSDLDLAFSSDRKLDIFWRSRIELAFADSELPYRVDIVDYSKAAPEFKRIIDANAVPLMF